MISRLIREGEARLSHHDIENPRLNSELLLSKVLKMERASLYFDSDRGITNDEVLNFKRLIQLRGANTPLQYLTGVQSFRNLELCVGSGVFIPRPETEQLVSIALDVIPAAVIPTKTVIPTEVVIPTKVGIKIPACAGMTSAGTHINCLDIGTGTGAIPLAITDEIKNTYFDAVEISADAFRYAEKNLNNYPQLKKRINLILFDIFKFKPIKKYDLIISNPPYIPSGMILNLPKEVSDGEPIIALDGGESGIDFLLKLADLITTWLSPGGYFVAEIGEDQGDRIIKHFKDKKFRYVSIKKDFNTRDRFLIAIGV